MRFLSCAWLVSLIALGCSASTDPSASISTGGAGTGGGATTTSGASGASGATSPSAGNAGSGSGSSCSSLAPVTRRLWRLSVEQYQSAVKDLLGLPSAPLLTNRGGEAQWAFFGDASLGVDDSFEYALYQVVDGILPSIPASVTACQSGEAPTACATRIANSLG